MHQGRILRAAERDVRVTDNGVHGRPDIVGHVGEEVVSGPVSGLFHPGPVLLFALHLRVDLVAADDQMPAVLILQQRRLRAHPGRPALHHQPVLGRKVPVPLHNRQHIVLRKDGHEAVLILRINDARHILPAQIEEILAALLNSQRSILIGGAVLHKIIRVGVDDVNAEIVAGQRLGDAAEGDPFRRRLLEGLAESVERRLPVGNAGVNLLFLFRDVRDKNRKDAAVLICLHIMPVIFHPPHFPVFADDPVDSVVDVLIAGPDLLRDRRGDRIKISRMHETTEGEAGQLLEILQILTAVKINHRFIHVEQPLGFLRLVNKKAAGHVSAKFLNHTERLIIQYKDTAVCQFIHFFLLRTRSSHCLCISSLTIPF